MSTVLGGIRLNEDGAIYSTEDIPDADSHFVGGLAFNAAGELHTTDVTSENDVFVNGLRVTTIGQLVVTIA